VRVASSKPTDEKFGVSATGGGAGASPGGESRAAGGAEWSIGRVLAWAAADFRGRGIESPRLDAELLLAFVLGVDRIRLIVEVDRPLSPAELGAFRELIKRRRGREPIAYILGKREFYGLDFRVDREVLIPRPDSETLVEVALVRTGGRAMYGRALDLCTGSGCIAVAFKKQRPAWSVTATDRSPRAVEVARENAVRLGTIWGVRFLVGDLTSPLRPSERFDLITANPPYIPSAEVDELDPGIRDYEPRLALDGGADGLDVARRIVREATPLLDRGGVLAIEVCAGQAGAVSELLGNAGLEAIERRKDYQGHERVVSGRKTS
jgi:release factor glutamine methyltransferase